MSLRSPEGPEFSEKDKAIIRSIAERHLKPSPLKFTPEKARQIHEELRKVVDIIGKADAELSEEDKRKLEEVRRKIQEIEASPTHN